MGGEALIDGVRSAAGDQANSVEPMVVPDEDVDGFLASCDVFVLLEGGIVEHDVAEAVVKQYGSRVLIRVPCTGGAAAKLVVPDNIEMNFERDTLQKQIFLRKTIKYMWQMPWLLLCTKKVKLRSQCLLRHSM